MSIDNLSFSELIGAFAVILLLLGIYNTVMAAVKNHRAEVSLKSEPITVINKRLDEYDSFFASDKRRIEKLEEAVAANMKENKMMIRMQLALVRHSIDGNNIEDLRKQRDEVQDYLIDNH